MYVTHVHLNLMWTLSILAMVVTMTSARTLCVSALAIPMITVTITMVPVTMVMKVMAFMPSFCSRCYAIIRLCIGFWSALLLGLCGLWGEGQHSENSCILLI